MNTIAVSLAAGVAIVLAGWCLVRAFTVGAVPVGTVYRRLYGDPQPASRTTAASRWEQPLAAIGRAVESSSWGQTLIERFRYQLRVADVSVATIATRVVSAIVVAWISSIVVLAAPLLGGLRVPVWLAVVGPFAVAALAGWYQATTIMTSLKRRHADFRAGVAAYVQLVSVCLTTRRSASEAVTYAADIGTGPAFDTIASAVHAAPAMGLQVWEALDAVGSEYGSAELEDLASSIANVSHIGVGVESTVLATAARMRQVGLDEMQRAADRQTATMFGPTILFVIGTIAFLAYPLAIRVLDAFSTST